MKSDLGLYSAACVSVSVLLNVSGVRRAHSLTWTAI